MFINIYRGWLLRYEGNRIISMQITLPGEHKIIFPPHCYIYIRHQFVLTRARQVKPSSLRFRFRVLCLDNV